LGPRENNFFVYIYKIKIFFLIKMIIFIKKKNQTKLKGSLIHIRPHPKIFEFLTVVRGSG